MSGDEDASSDEQPLTRAEIRAIARDEAVIVYERMAPILMNTMLQGFERMGFFPNAAAPPAPLNTTSRHSQTPPLPPHASSTDLRSGGSISSGPALVSSKPPVVVNLALPVTPPHSPSPASSDVPTTAEEHTRGSLRRAAPRRLSPPPSPTPSVTRGRSIFVALSTTPSRAASCLVVGSTPGAAGSLATPYLQGLARASWRKFLDALPDPIYPNRDNVIPYSDTVGRNFYVVIRGFKTGVFYFANHADAATKMCGSTRTRHILEDALEVYNTALEEDRVEVVKELSTMYK